MIHHDVAHGGKMEDAARRVNESAGGSRPQDHMDNPQTALDFAALMGAKTLVLDSDCGHLSNTRKAEVMNSSAPC